MTNSVGTDPSAKPAAGSVVPPDLSVSAKAAALTQRQDFSTPSCRWRKLLLALVVVSLGAAVLWGYREIQRTKAHLSEIKSQLASNQLFQQQDRQQFQRILSELQGKQNEADSRVQTLQEQQLTLSNWLQQINLHSDAFVVAEVEQLVQLAQQQLQVANYPQGALSALQSAEKRLARVNRSTLTPLHRALLQEIDKLQRLPFVDVVGIHLQLTNLANEIETLPILSTVNVATKKENTTVIEGNNPLAGKWRQFWHAWWADLAQLVKINRIESTALPLLSPEQEFFLRENLKLKLTATQLALASRDQAYFQASLKDAAIWLERFFDGQQAPVQTGLLTLRQLKNISIGTDLPDLSAVESALQQAKNATQDVDLPHAPSSRRNP